MIELGIGLVDLGKVNNAKRSLGPCQYGSDLQKSKNLALSHA